MEVTMLNEGRIVSVNASYLSVVGDSDADSAIRIYFDTADAATARVELDTDNAVSLVRKLNSALSNMGIKAHLLNDGRGN